MPNAGEEHPPERTLLLNASYEPLKVIGWQRAVSLTVAGKVVVVETYARLIRSPSVEIQLPAVVRLQRYLRWRRPRPAFGRRAIFLRDQHTCQYCGVWRPPGSPTHPGTRLTLDHVLPRSRGGATCWENIVTCCERCNHDKGGRTPDEAGMALRQRPYQPTWSTVGLGGLPLEAAPNQWRLYLRAA